MATEYMDYGIIYNPKGNNVLPRVEVDHTKRGQVYYSTHEGEGLSLSFTDKAFISFTYGDRKIEDFGLIAVTVNDRLDRLTPPDHEDHVTEYKMLHGQYYWGSHYNAREMDITLATDGMTQDQLDNFKAWFRAGEIRELILSLHPNRAIMARIGLSPKVSVLPFKQKKYMTINEQDKLIHETIYKGNIDLKFVMDEPFWYAVHDVLGHRIELDDLIKIVDEWTDVHGNEKRSIFDDEDALKIVIEDHIPTASMFYNKTNLANGLLLIPYDERKYTIETYEGAPIINNESGIGSDNYGNYAINGAIVGPIYRSAYQEEDRITTIDAKDCIFEYILNDTGNLEIPQYTNEADDLHTQNVTTTFYYPVKKNSMIALKSFKDADVFSQISVIISKYTKVNDIYIHKAGENEILSNSSSQYIANSNEFIRITIRIKNMLFSTDNVAIMLLDNSTVTIDKNDPMSFFNLLLLNLIVFNTNEGEKINKENKDGLSYFYSGTAPSYPIISFNVPIVFDNNGYIISFNNNYTNNLSNAYNSLVLLSATKHELKITNPSIFNSYNKVINILHSSIDITVTELIKLLREEIGHIGVRNWIIGCINIYYNNHNQNITLSPSLIVTSLIKLTLLTYMPYLFATFDEADIILKAEPAAEVSMSSIELPKTWPTFERKDALKQRFGIKGNILKVETFTDNIINNENLTPIFSVATKQTLNDGILYWRWQYSRGDGKWYLLFDKDNVWEGVDTSTLTCYSLSELNITDNNPLYLRCIISNNVSYTGTGTESILAVQLIDDTLLVECTTNNLTVDYNQTATINWTVTGDFITTSQATLGDAQYKPRIYYYNENQNIDWTDITAINNLDEFVKQIESYSFNIDQNIITVSFKAHEDENKTLRGTKFKIRLYKVTANDPLSSNDYIESESPILQITRLEIGNISLSVTANDISTLYSDLPPDVLNYLGNTQITLILSGIINFNLSDSWWEYRQIGTTKWNTLTRNNSALGLEYTVSNNNIKLEGSFYEGDPASDVLPTYEFRFRATAYGLTKYIVDLKTLVFKIHQWTNAQLNESIIEAILPRKAQTNRQLINYNSTGIKMYVTSKSTIEASYPSVESNNMLPANSHIVCSYQWQKTNEVDDQGEPINWGNIDGATEKQYLISESQLTMNTTMLYRCIITLARIKKNNDLNTVSNDELLNYSENKYISCWIYLQPEIISVNGGLQNATYYSSLHLLLLSDGSSQTTQTISDNASYTIVLNCNVNNLSGINLSTVVWYKIGSDGKSVKTDYKNLSQSLLLTADMLSKGDLIASYYCTFYDYLNQPYSSQDNLLKILYIVKSSRIQLIPLLSSYNRAQNLSWGWPVIKYEWGGSAISITPSTETIQTTVTSSFTDDGKGYWEYSGIFPPLNRTSYSNYQGFTEYQNTLLPLYLLQLALFQTICSFPEDLWGQYGQIQFKLQCTNKNNSSDYVCELKVLCNETLIISNSDNLYIIERPTPSAAININLRLYSNIIWPQNIGFRTGSGANTQKYNPDNWPTAKGNFSISLSDLKGVPQQSSVSTNGLLNMQPLSLKLSPKNSVTRSNLVEPIPMLTMSNENDNIIPHHLQLNSTCNFKMNNNTGEYFMTVKYNYITQPNGFLTNEISSGTFDSSPNNICYFSNLRQNNAMIESVESVGDMILSNNLIFEEQNHFDLNNVIQPWSELDPTLSHKLTYDGDIPLLNFELTYKNYYL